LENLASVKLQTILQRHNSTKPGMPRKQIRLAAFTPKAYQLPPNARFEAVEERKMSADTLIACTSEREIKHSYQ
jgi:hypothetical protein